MSKVKTHILVKIDNSQHMGAGKNSVVVFMENGAGEMIPSPPLYYGDLTAPEQEIHDNFEAMYQAKIDLLP